MACLVIGSGIGWYARDCKKVPEVAMLRARARVHTPDMMPLGEITILGQAEGIEESTEDSPTMATYRVKVLGVVDGKLDTSIIHVHLPTLYMSNEAWHGYKIPIKGTRFKAIFVLNRIKGNVYAPAWIVPEDALAWPPSGAVLNFIARAARP